jgi:membrane complex biogenesis BtpA family protein
MTWLKDLFNVEKPIIAMCHLQPLPGDPNYDEKGGMEKVIDLAKKDLLALEEGGVDGIMFSNEFSLPYLTKTEPITAISMARIIGELKDDIKIPFGVNVLWDAVASLDLAVAVDGKFIREVISGAYASDFGLWSTDPGATARHRARIGGKDIKMIFNIFPEAAKYLADRDITEIARTTEFNNRPDTICVSGITAGSVTDTQILKLVKDAVKSTPILVNTGCNKENVVKQLSVSDGAISATTFKINGVFENPVDQVRVKEFMDVVKNYRKSLH